MDRGRRNGDETDEPDRDEYGNSVEDGIVGDEDDG